MGVDSGGQPSPSDRLWYSYDQAQLLCQRFLSNGNCGHLVDNVDIGVDARVGTVRSASNSLLLRLLTHPENENAVDLSPPVADGAQVNANIDYKRPISLSFAIETPTPPCVQDNNMLLPPSQQVTCRGKEIV